MCARLYAGVLTNPLGMIGHQPCIPDSMAAPSFKYSSRLRTSFTIGTSQVGGVAVWPHSLGVTGQLTANNGAPYDLPKVRCTTSTYGEDGAQFARSYGVPVGTQYAGTINNNACSSMFSATDFTNRSRSLRLVGSGLRVTYTGSVTDQRGTVYYIRNPTATCSLPDTFDNIDEIASSQDVVRANVRDMSARGTNGVAYRPLASNDTSMVSEPYSSDNLLRIDTVPARLGYVVMVVGATPGTSFDIDVISFFEAYGASLPLTPSEADPVGISVVRAAVSPAPRTSDTNVQYADVLIRALKQLAAASGKHALRSVAPVVGDLLGGAFADLAMGDSGRRNRGVVRALMNS